MMRLLPRAQLVEAKGVMTQLASDGWRCMVRHHLGANDGMEERWAR
jgi:hypothetical protein